MKTSSPEPPQQQKTNPSSHPHHGYALFDLDQTLIPWDTQLLFCNFVLKRMPIRRLYLLTLIPLLPFYKFLGDERLKRVFLNYLWKLTPDELDRLATDFVSEIFPDAFYPEMLNVLEEQKSLGRTIILSSASPEIWVKAIAQQLGVDYAFGTTVEVSPSVKLFPSIIGGNNKRENKLRKMHTVLPKGFSTQSGDKLPNSHGFSDSHADSAMLNICENASMVNPTNKLSAEGNRKNWHTFTPPRPTKGKFQFAIACLRQALGIY